MKIHCLFDKMVNVHELKPHPKNMNKHPKEQIERLAKILEYQGFRYPIKVSKQSGFITSGHGRLEAAKFLKLTQVPVNYQGYENDAQEYADIVADNSIASWADLDLSAINHEVLNLPDFDIDLLGIEDFKIVEPVVAKCDEDEVPEQVPTVSVLGDLYELGNHRLLCGDSTSIDAVEKLMDGEKADMVFTDPPYGGEVVGKAGGPETGFNKSINKLKRATDFISNFNPNEFIQILAFLNAPSSYVFTNLSILNKYLTENSKILVWHKKHGLPSVGNYNSDIEFLVFTKQPGAYFNSGDQDLSYSRLISMIKSDRDLHPTMKPIALIENCLKISSENNNIVIDLFGGSGSTLIACEKTNRKCFMAELDPHYVSVIVARWCKYTGRDDVILNGEKISWKELNEKGRNK